MMNAEQLAALRKWQEYVDEFMVDSMESRRATDTQIDGLRRELVSNTESTDAIGKNVQLIAENLKKLDGLADIAPTVKDMSGAVRTLRRAAWLLHPFVWVGGAVVAFVIYLKTGHWEWPKT